MLVSYFCSGLTAATTFASAANYAFSKSVYKFKFRDHDHQYGKRTAVFIFYILLNITFVYLMPTRYSDSLNKQAEGDSDITSKTAYDTSTTSNPLKNNAEGKNN